MVEPPTPPSLVSTERYVEGALRLYSRAMEAWGASDEQMRSVIGLRSVSILRRWREPPPKALNPDHLRRIGTVLSIWKALGTVHGSPAAARHWIVNENASLGGRSPGS